MIDKIKPSGTITFLPSEDPIEFVHMTRTGGSTQRELHADTSVFADALRAALREDPDVVLIGEMRDLETIDRRCVSLNRSPYVRHHCTPTRIFDHQSNH